MSHSAIIADLRRLYHHMQAHGKWDYNIDTSRLENAIVHIEDLHQEIDRLENAIVDMEINYDDLAKEYDDVNKLWDKFNEQT